MALFKSKFWTATVFTLTLALIIAGVAFSCSWAGPADISEIITADTTTIERTVEVDQQTLDEISFTKLSSNFVDRVIHDLPVDKHLKILKNVNPDVLDDSLDTPRKRLTFWINIYNGYTQYFLKTDPSLYKKNRNKFFSKAQIPIAGYTVSMEDVEHGVLRKGATIWSKGYIRIRAFRKDFIQKYFVDTVDYRIHFTLNCGAKSCPPVVAYQEKYVARQLNDNTRYYLNKEVQYNEEKNVVKAPVLMNWFSADFGGSDEEKRAILKEYGALPKDVNPKLKYLSYDWTVKIENYKSFGY